jgi:copper homeostasis protein
MAMQRILVEICCGSLEDALEAERGGADRVELCSALFLGGLTPSLGTIIEAKARLKIPIMVMIRPRGGGFCYTEPEMAVMERDTVLAAEQGADGMVFGILNADGGIDEERCTRIRKPSVIGRLSSIALSMSPPTLFGLWINWSRWGLLES